MAFNLFDNEEKVIEEGERLILRLAGADQETRQGVSELLDAYRKTYRETRRMVRISDRFQKQLGALNQELQRKKEEAETALQSLKVAQDSLIQAEKLASLGALVAGVSHEINTPVGIALAAASHLSDATRETRKIFDEGRIKKSTFADYMETAAEASSLVLSNCQRAAELINSFKQVAVDQTSAERRSFPLGAYIREVLRSLSPRLRHGGVKVSVDCPTDLVIDSFPGALSQVLTNFLMNSVIHGFEGRAEGEVRIAVTLSSPDTVELCYRDNGKGIPAEIRPRVFDPFFTTKRGSGGNGLGLHVVFNIVTGTLKGQIAVESELGQGTSFTVTFPRIAPGEEG